MTDIVPDPALIVATVTDLLADMLSTAGGRAAVAEIGRLYQLPPRIADQLAATTSDAEHHHQTGTCDVCGWVAAGTPDDEIVLREVQVGPASHYAYPCCRRCLPAGVTR